MKTRLYTPGPVHVPQHLLDAISGSNIHHRTAGFGALFQQIRRDLKSLFVTSSEVLTFVASGTGGMECAVANTVAPGDKVLVVRGGKFSARWGDICRAYGAKVVTVDHVPGTAVDPDAVEAALKANDGIKVAFLTHCETSTGALNDIQTLAGIVRRYGAWVVVDAISSIVPEPFFMDRWGIDLAVCASHKGLQLPPGLAFICASDRLLQALAREGASRSFYFDILRTHASQRRGQTPFTPSTHLMLGLAESLRRLTERGLPEIWEHFREKTHRVRSQLRELDLEIFNEQDYSHGITVFRVPEGLRLDELVRTLDADFGFRLGEGQDELHDKVLRLSHLGGTSIQDERDLFAALRSCLNAQRQSHRISDLAELH